MGGCHGEGAFLNWNTKVDTIFFSWWRANTAYTFLLAVIIIWALAFAFEGMNNVRSQYESALTKKINMDDYSPQLGDKLIRSLLHTLMVGYGLFLMMIFMTYNGTLMVALVAGHGCGHLFFSEWLPEDPAVSRVKTCCC